MSWITMSGLLNKLAAISPMPSDSALLDDDDDRADRYDALIEEIDQHLAQEQLSPAEERELVSVLADSFGLGSGMGIFWGTLHLLEKCTPDVMYPIVQNKAAHGLPGSRYWCCYILGRRRDVDDLPLFLALLDDDVPEVQEQALKSLEMLSQVTSLRHVLPRIFPLAEHADPKVRKAALCALEAIGQ